MFELIQSTANENFVLTWCLIIGFSVLVIMWKMSLTPKRDRRQREYNEMYEPEYQSLPYRILRFLLLGF